MSNVQHNRDANLESPVWDAATVTPADSDLGRTPTRAVYVGGAGTLAVQMAGGTTVVFTGVAAGTVLPIRVDQIRSTSTTATAILALY